MLDLNGVVRPKCRLTGTCGSVGRVQPAIGLGQAGNQPLGLFGDGRQGYSAPESTPAGCLSGECRVKQGLIVGGLALPAD